MRKIILLFCLIAICGIVPAQQPVYEPGRLIVKVAEASDIDLQNWLADQAIVLYGIQKIEHVFHARDTRNSYAARLNRTYSICLPENMIDQAIAFFFTLDFIEYAERVPLIELLYIPDDSLYKTSILGANPIWPLQNIHATTAWDYTHGSPDIKIAIVDNAIWTSHPDLAGKFVDIWDFADNDNNTDPYSFSNDAYGRQWTHGTHVAGLAGAQTDNNRGIASIGFNSSLMAYKMYNNGTIPLPNLTAGCTAIQEAADRGAHVINVSWGSTNALTAIQDAVNYAHNKGCVIVAAAGNNGQDQAYYPAGYDHVIAVAAVGMDDKKSSFSNFGDFVDVTAPGGYGPNDAGTWSLVSTVSHVSYAWNAILGNVNYDGKVGTSSATPMVSGLCALMLSLDSTLSPDEIETILKTTSIDISALNTAYSGKLGAGRIDAGAAVAYVAGTTGIANNQPSALHIYPNPSAGSITISGGDASIKSIRVLNMTGQVIGSLTQIKSGELTYQFPGNIVPGLYLLQINAENGFIYEKIMLAEGYE